MNYSNFRFSAVVDWIELEICTENPTNFQTLRRHCDLDFAHPLDKSSGGAASVFRIRLQDPECWQDVDKKLKEIAAIFPLATMPVVSGIEVSLDGYSRSGNRDELIELGARFYKFQSRPASTNRRFSGRFRGDVEGIQGGMNRLRQKLAAGRVIALGNQASDRHGRWIVGSESQRIYIKCTDKGGKVSLPEAQHRARIERTLQEEAIPVTELDGWKAFRFETMTPNFRFRALKDDLDPLLRLIAERADQVGERKPRPRAKKDKSGFSGTRLYSRVTRADRHLNDLAKGALRGLTRRWQSQQSWGEKCGKSGELHGKSPIKSVPFDASSINYIPAFQTWPLSNR